MGRDAGQRALAIGLGVVGALMGAIISLAGPGRPPATVVTATPEASPSVGQVVAVHVSGWVLSPGVVWVPEGSLAVTAIEAAGGAREGARLDQVNLARPVHEGDQLHVPGPDAAGEQTADVSGGLVDINAADATALQQLPGVGPVLAERIIDHRESVGRFEAIEDLLDVPGIGEARLAAMRDLIQPP